jgi:large subunit ribosomal protein L20
MNKGNIFKLAKGFRGRAKNCIRIARERVEKALQYSYRGSAQQEEGHAIALD